MKLNVFSLVVADMAASLDFYRHLGLQPNVHDDHAEADLGAGMKLMWDTVTLVRSLDPTWVPPAGGARFGLAVECDSVSGVDDAVAALAQQGYRVHREPWDAFWGQRYATVLDPDGNLVDLYAPR